MPEDRRHSIDVIIDCDAWENLCSTGEESSRTQKTQNTSADSFWEHFILVILEKIAETLNLSPSYSLSVLLTDDDASQKLNLQFRNKDNPTNVLSFPSAPSSLLMPPSSKDDIFLGDLAFAYGVIEREAKKDCKDFQQHMTHLAIHGILHLLGYDHENESDAAHMEELEIQILKHFNIGNPYT